MNNHITYTMVINRLEKNDLLYKVVQLDHDIRIIISQHGGRIFGPFLSEDSESVFWINKAFKNAEAFKNFLDAGEWNLGGERIWIAPEIQYSVKDRTDFFGSYTIPAQVDPGQYILTQPHQQQALLCLNMNLEMYNLASGQKELLLKRLIRKVDDPLRNLSNYQQLIEDVIFGGFEQNITLSETISDNVMSEVWDLIQLNPGGEILLPVSPCVEYTDYYELIDESFQTRNPHDVRLKITGNRRYKVGYKAAHLFGRVGYFNIVNETQAYLIVRNFFNNPSAPYAEEPFHTTGCRGHSFHVFNDDGGFGGFGELECNGQTIGASTGKSSSTDQFVLWFYEGSSEKVKTIAFHLLGIECGL
jgi:hypothetical protein